MSKIAKAVCAVAGAAVNGAVAAVSGGNPILVALSGGATNLISEEVGEIVREDELVELFQTKPDAFLKIVAETKKDTKKGKTAEIDAAKAEVSETLKALVEEARKQNALLMATARPQLEEAAAREAEKAEKATKVAMQKAMDAKLAELIPILDQVEAYKARMAKAEKKAANG